MQNEYAAQLVAMPLSKFRSIRKAVAVLRRTGMPTERALELVMEALWRDSSIAYAAVAKR